VFDISNFEAVDISTGGNRCANFVGAIPGNLAVAFGLEFVIDQCFYFLAHRPGQWN